MKIKQWWYLMRLRSKIRTFHHVMRANYGGNAPLEDLLDEMDRGHVAIDDVAGMRRAWTRACARQDRA